MATFLRRSALFTRIPTQVFGAVPRQSHIVQRPSLSRCVCAQQRIRWYASKPDAPKESRDEKRVSSQDNAARQKPGQKPRQPRSAKEPLEKAKQAPPGSEPTLDHARTSPPSPDQSQENNANTGEEPVSPKMSEEDEKWLDKLVVMLKKGLPRQQGEEVERSVQALKKQGLPPELEDTLKKLRAGEPFDLGMAAKLMRLTSQLARKIAEEQSADKYERPSQKSSDDPGPQDPRDKKSNQGKPMQGFPYLESFRMDTGTFIVSAFVTFMLYRMIVPGENEREITWQEFRGTFLEKGLVEKIVIFNQKRARVYLHRESVSSVFPDSPASDPNFFYYFTIGSVEAFEKRLEEAQNELEIPSSDRIPVAYTDQISWLPTLLSFGPSLIFLALLLIPLRRMSQGGGGQSGIFGMGRSRAKKFNHETDVKVKFADVAGMDEAKQEIMEFVSFLKEPGIYQKLGAKIPRGAILSGPPGTGKTLLAKATAGESQVPFFTVSGSEFVEMFVGVGPSRVRDLFAEARKNTPCIIFIDEIDAIGKSRAKQNFGGGNDERESTLNQILTEMDGFNTSEQVVVLAGTNRPDVLDQALMRPGRFDRHIAIDRPTMEGRKQIFGVHLQKIVTNVDMEHLKGRLAALTPGFSGADIANCVNEAALIGARGHAQSVEMMHFEQAIERVVGGLEKKSLVLSPEDKRTVAYHEAGHAICGWYFKYADPLLKVSIIPRGQGALGYAQYLPQGDTYLMNVNQLMDRMAMTLAGRVSEELHFDTVTSGASDDFNKVTRMATAMVTKWGMSRKIGYLYFEDDSQQQLHKPFSEETAKNIDAEVRRIVDEAYKQCVDLLTEKRAEVGIVAEELLRKEMLTRDDMVRLLGKRPFDDKEDFAKYFGTPGSGSVLPPPQNEPPAPPLPGDLPGPGAPAPTA